MFIQLLTIVLAISTTVLGQQAGTQAENHPPLPWQQCQKGGHCSQVHGEIVLDANWRWFHNGQNTNCFNDKENKWDTTSCPDAATCAKNCMLEGADYTNYKVTTSGNALTQKMGSRLYLAANASTYQMFHLLGQEFTFDIDISTIPCGMNAALYFVSMEADGGTHSHPNNKAGAKFGTGYCDAQCGKDRFLNLADNNPKHGACCSEMDIWEANSMAAVYTLHPCTTAGYHTCTDNCGSTCESGGCGFNSYGMGDHSYYGPGLKVDTNKVFTVVTQFITSDGTANGALQEIKRFYVQNGHVIPNSESKISNVHGNSISTAFCDAQGGAQSSFNKHGGVKQMGAALKNGMVLTIALWDDYGGHMMWLDGGNNGPCAANSGDPKEIEAKYPNAHVIYSNIKVGPINSTFHA